MEVRFQGRVLAAFLAAATADAILRAGAEEAYFVVTGEDGKHVTDLKQEDLSIIEAGRPRDPLRAGSAGGRCRARGPGTETIETRARRGENRMKHAPDSGAS